MTDPEPLPCPFCGGPANGPIFSSMCVSGSKEIYAVECPKCMIDVEGEACNSSERSKSTAIAAWNTRIEAAGVADLQAQLMAKDEEIAILRAYAQHRPSCRMSIRIGGACTCGLREKLAKARSLASSSGGE